MTFDLATSGAAVSGVGLAGLMLGSGRCVRIVGLAAWGIGAGILALSVAPSGHHVELAAAAVVGLVFALLLALLFTRLPWALAVAVLACAPARIPVSRLGSPGGATANLLLPLYVVVVGAVLSLAWQFYRGDRRSRELGPFAWPLGLFVAWDAIALTWSQAGAGEGRHAGAVDLLFYVLPLGVLAVSLARLPWSLTWTKRLYGQLAAMALAFAAIGVWQYFARDIFWNSKVKVDNVYAPSSLFFRVNSIFYDPSIYGRFLVVAIAASLVLVLFAPGRIAWVGAAVASGAVVGLLPSFSQSSFVALGAATVVALVVMWRRRVLVPVAVALIAVLLLSLGVPQLRHRMLGHASISGATGDRSSLVRQGVELFLHHPLVGVGTGSFAPALAAVAPDHSVKLSASHDAPITVAAETGLPGLALLIWLLALVFTVPFRRTRSESSTGRARLGFGLGLVAIVVHTLFYNALFEDPLFWTLIALSAVALRDGGPVREPEPEGAAA